ncbi:MAG: hypothetical protein ACPGOS_02385 [Gammaproteobacteria bacterium]
MEELCNHRISEIFFDWFHEFFDQACSKLAKEGAFFMEGHEDSLVQLKQIASAYFSHVEIKEDYTRRNRFLYGYK